MTAPAIVPTNAPTLPTAPAGPKGGGDSLPSFDKASAKAAAVAVLDGDAPVPGTEEAAPPPDREGVLVKPEEAAKEKDASQDDLTKEWIRFRNQEKRLKERAREFSDEKGKHEAEKQTYAKEKAEFEAARTRAKTHPLEALKSLGWSFDDLVHYVGKNGQIPHQKLMDDLNLQMDEKMKSTQEKLEAMEKAAKQAERQAQIQDYERKAEHEIRSTLDNYPHLKRLAEGDGFEVEVLPGVFKFLDHHARQGNYLPPSAALQYYEERLSKLAPRVMGDPAQGGPVKTGEPEAAKPSPRPEYLTNDDTSERGSADADDDADVETLRRRAKALLAS